MNKISIKENVSNEGLGESCQIFSDIVPTIGSKFDFYSSRYSGDYDPAGKASRVFSGIVKKIDYFLKRLVRML